MLQRCKVSLVVCALALCGLALCGFAIFGFAKTRFSRIKLPMKSNIRNVKRPRFIQTKPADIRRARNELSAMLNSMKLDFAKMACEIEELRSKVGIKEPNDKIPGCIKPIASDKRVSPFDAALAEELLGLWTNQSVAVLGDPTGSYKRYFDFRQGLRICDSYDSAPYVPESSRGIVQFLDFTAPQYGLPVYDWVMSWQVSQHVSFDSVDVYVDNLARHSGTGLVLVWPDNTTAVNTKTKAHGALTLKGLHLDETKTEKLRDVATLDIVKQNTLVYKRDHRLPSPLDA